jgi:predicted dehydrogenase
MSKIRVGIIGCGEFAEFQHFPNCLASSQVKIVAICDLSPERLDYIVRKFQLFHVLKTTDYRLVFALPELELVIAATDHSLHPELVAQAAKHGKHILIEKPMAMTQIENHRILRMVKGSGIKLCVDYNRPFSPSMRDLKKELDRQRTSPSLSAWRTVRSDKLPELYEEKAVNLAITVNDEIDSYRIVHLDPERGGGQIIGESCHFLDLACWLIGSRPIRIYATGSTRLNHGILVDFADGSLANILFSACGTFDYPKERYEITAGGNFFLNEFFVETAIYGRGEPIIRTYPLQFDEVDEVSGAGLEVYLAKRSVAQKKIWERGTLPALMPDKGHRQLLDAFVESIREDKPSPVDEVRGARATYLADLAIQSIRTGLPLPARQEELELLIN